MANRRSVLVAAALSLSVVGVASGEEGISVSPMHQDLGSWLFVPVMNGATVDSFVALKKDQSNADVTTVWFQHRVEGGWDKLACTNTNQEIAIDAIMYELELPHEQRRHWPESQRFVMDGRSDPIDDLIRRLPPDAARRVFNAVYDVEFVPSAISVFDDVDCEDHKILAWMSDTASNFHGLDGGVDSVTIDGANALDACEYTADLHAPVITFTNMGDAPRVDSQDREYYLESDNVIYTVEAHDWDRGVIPAELFVNDEPFQQGQAIEGIGLHFIRAVVEDDFGSQYSIMDIVNIRPRIDRYGHAYLIDREVIFDRDQGAFTRYTINITAGDFIPFDMRISTLHLTGFDEDQGNTLFRAYIKGMFRDDDGSIDVANAEFGISEYDITAVFEVGGEIPEGTELNVFGVGTTPGNDSEQFEIDLNVAEVDPVDDPTPIGDRPPGFEGNQNPTQDCRVVLKVELGHDESHLGVGSESVLCEKKNRDWHSNPNYGLGHDAGISEAKMSGHFAKGAFITGKASSASKFGRIQRHVTPGSGYCGIETKGGIVDGVQASHLRSRIVFIFEHPCPQNCQKVTFRAEGECSFEIKGDIYKKGVTVGGGRITMDGPGADESISDSFSLAGGSNSDINVQFGVRLTWPPTAPFLGITWTQQTEEQFPPASNQAVASDVNSSILFLELNSVGNERIQVESVCSLSTMVRWEGSGGQWSLWGTQEHKANSQVKSWFYQIKEYKFEPEEIPNCTHVHLKDLP